jgi:hypothetical protein
MHFNIVNGDSLANSFPASNIDGNIVVFREALVDGDVSVDDRGAFWKSRARFLNITDAEYHTDVVTEIEKIQAAPDKSTFNLWFEYDLFCQVNMWFVISIISNLPITKQVFVVYTSHLDKPHQRFWNGFGPATPGELNRCYANKIPLSEAALQFGAALWQAYKNADLEQLTRLSRKCSPAFPYLSEVIRAHVDRFPKNGDTKGRPGRVVEDIINNISTDFNEVCKKFWKRERIYGFGDTQVKEIYDKVMGDR